METTGTRLPDPDDDRRFDAIVAGLDLDVDAIEQAAALATELPPSTTAAEPDITKPAAPRPAPAWRLTEEIERRDTSSAPPVSEPLAPPPPPELVVLPRPIRPEGGVVNWWAEAFPHIVWLSVVAGLTGQIFGFAEFFGGTKIAWAIAAVLGGTFEFMMVACSSRGLRAIGLGRGRWECTPFLLLGTAAAGFAAYMNVNHFDGWLGLAAGTVSLLGYFAHVFAHLYEELEHREQLHTWEQEKEAIEAEIKTRAAADRAEYDDYRADLVAQRKDLARQRAEDRATAAEPSSPAEDTSTTSHRRAPAKPGGKPGEKRNPNRVLGMRDRREQALQLGVSQRASTPAKLRAAMQAAGLKLPSSDTTLENWCREIKARLGETN